MRSESLAVRKPADDAVVSMAPNWIRLPFLTQTRIPADNPVMTAPLALSRVEQRGILPDAEALPQDAYDRGKHALGTGIPQALPRPGPPLGGLVGGCCRASKTGDVGLHTLRHKPASMCNDRMPLIMQRKDVKKVFN